MTLERKIAKVFNLTDKNWEKHSNPISVYTRYSVLPLIIGAFWSRAYIGDYYMIPAALSLGWMFFNPIFFKKPKSTNNWASKCVIGERIYLNRDKVDIPKHHKTKLIGLLNTISSIGMGLTIYGTINYNIEAAVGGVALAYLGKSWFLDRMNWLAEDMKEHKEYKKMFY